MQRLGFHDDFIVNDQVRSISADNDSTVQHLKRHFALNSQAGVLECHG